MSRMYKKTINIKKKILFSSAVIAMFSNAYGAPSQEKTTVFSPQKIVSDSQNRFSGMFFGMHSGFTHLLAHNHFIQTGRHPRAEAGLGGIETIGSNGGLIGMHAIVGKVFDDNFYVGGEINTSYYFLKGLNRNQTYYEKCVTYQLKDSYSVALRIGVYAGSALVYVKSGAVLTHRTVRSVYPNNADVEPYMTRGYKKGLLAGFGVEVPLDKNIALGLEADYTHYKNDKVFHARAANYSINTSTYNVKFKISFKI